jgi:hypothetical protein
MTMNRHESFEELISASLTGDLTPPERQRLDAHLDSCVQCRATLAAFADQRRIMTGLRHVAPPRDLGARVRTGIERGRFAPVPWWRRPAVIFTGVGGSLAAVAGALLAIVLLNGAPSGPETGQITATPPLVSASPSATSRPTLPPIATPTSDASPGESPASVAPSPTVDPNASPPEPDVVMVAAADPDEAVALAVVEGTTADGPEFAVEPTTGNDTTEPMAPSGPPIVAELSPDGQWLAFITEIGQRGVNDVWATRLTEAPEPTDPDAPPPIDSTLAVGTTVHLGQSVAGSPFLERLAWSSGGRYLAYTLADPETDEADADAWIFETEPATTRQLTDTGDAFAASWAPGTAGTSLLWVSTAGEEPMSHLLDFHDEAGGVGEPIDPADDAVAEAEGVFQPLLSPNGSLAIFWRGRMSADPDLGWVFTEDGAPYLAEHDIDDGTFAFSDERKVFSDLPSRGALFTSAAITWGLDGDAYAIWDTAWSEEVAYPNPSRVYFGHATDGHGLTRVHAIDRDDVDPELVIVDVEVAPTGQHLLITARARPGGVGDPLRAELWLVTRHTGDVPDESERKQFSDDGWVGPAVFLPEPEWDSSLAP